MVRIPRFSLLVIFAILGAVLKAESYVEFAFEISSKAGNPYTREIWAQVVTPGNTVVRVPVFYDGNSDWRVRVQASEPGVYRLERVTETIENRSATPTIRLKSGETVKVSQASPIKFIQVDPKDVQRFIFSDGRIYYPFGINLAWGDGAFYERAFNKFKTSGLNWTRIWMAHWSGLNLDWPGPKAKALEPGAYDLQTANRWDSIVARAEENGVFIQLVLQHHGQYSTTVNPNWPENPWNIKNGGFLKTPQEFFTSDEARQRTKSKYRYIVARWGYSPAILSWELFNEVHWVDSWKLDKDSATVAHWHAEMADYIRSIDPYHHLVTTSCDDVGSEVFTAMDYYQPHLYALNMLAGARRFTQPIESFKKPIFYGEIGDDNMAFSATERKLGRLLMPMIWAGLMGNASAPAQPWYWDRMLDSKLFDEMTSVASFMREADLAQESNLTALRPIIDTSERVPWIVGPAYSWRPGGIPHVVLSENGLESDEIAEIPSNLVGSETSNASEFASGFRLSAHYSSLGRPRLSFNKVPPEGARLRVLLEGNAVISQDWPALVEGISENRTYQQDFEVSPGDHDIEISNLGPGNLKFSELDTGLTVPALAAYAKRNDHLVVAWIYHRRGIYADSGPAVSGNMKIPALPAGRWQLTWWDTKAGKPGTQETKLHEGGEFLLTTPPVSRDMALILKRGI